MATTTNKRYCPNCGREVNTTNKHPDVCPQCESVMVIKTPDQNIMRATEVPVKVQANPDVVDNTTYR